MKKVRVLSLALAVCLLASSLCPAWAYQVHSYSEGLAQAEERGKWGFAGEDGKLVIPIQYDSVVSFSLGTATVNLNGHQGVIRPDGEYLIPAQYDTLMPVGYGLYLAQKDDLWGVVSILPYTNADGETTNEVYPITYAAAELGVSGGVNAIILTSKGGGRTVVPLFQIPAALSQLGVEGVQFALTRGRVPSFSDVDGKDWFALWVDLVYNTGIMAGTGGNQFEPRREVTVAEAIQMAANMDSRYRGDTFHTTAHVSTPWYNEAVSYCLASGIISNRQFDDYTRLITRRELAQLFAATELSRSVPRRNDLHQVRRRVSDVDAADPAAGAIYELYAKGILTGVNANLAVRPDAPVYRAEAAALAARLARP